MQQPDRITTAEVMRRINAGEKLVFVDVRKDEDWNASEELIGGATRVPPDAIEAHVARLPGNPLILYCACPHEATSMRVARDLLGRNFREVRVLEGGFEGWKQSKGFLASKPAGGDSARGEVHTKQQEVTQHSTGTTKTDDVASMPREGVGGGHAVATPMGNPPSAHRKQPDDAAGLHKTGSQEREGDIAQRTDLKPGGPQKPRESRSVPGDIDSKRMADRPSQRHSQSP